MSGLNITQRRAFRRTDNYTPGTAKLKLVHEALSLPLSPTAVLLKVHAVALNYRDANIANGGNPWPVLPHGILCNDAVGEVIAVGDHVKSFAVGDRAGPITDTKNLSGREVERSWLAADEDGVMADHIVFDEAVLCKLPDYLDWVEAATIPCAGVTAWSALKDMSVGQTVLIQGTGGVSVFALKLARAAGLKVILTSSSDNKLEQTKEKYSMPPILTVNYSRNQDWALGVMKLTNGVGVDIVVENGGTGSLVKSLRCTRRGGIVSQVGYLSKQDPNELRDLIPTIIDRRIILRGINAGSKIDMDDFCAALWVNQTPLHDLIDKVFAFECAEEAVEYVWQGRSLQECVLYGTPRSALLIYEQTRKANQGRQITPRDSLFTKRRKDEEVALVLTITALVNICITSIRASSVRDSVTLQAQTSSSQPPPLGPGADMAELGTILEGTPYVTGSASATLLASELELSFWGGVNAQTGEVIDRFHPLSGRFLKDTILAIPGGRGSCTGSIVMMELILNGLGPKGLIFERREEIVTLGVMVAEEMFGKSVPVVTLGPDNFRQVLKWDGKKVHIQHQLVSDDLIQSDPAAKTTRSVDDLKHSNIRLSDKDRAMIDGAEGEATRVAMTILIRIASMMKASELIDITQAHVDACWYGPGSVAFGKQLRDSGGVFRVPTTINAVNVDLKRWQALGIGSELGTTCDELAKVFVDMGGTPASFTCAPYLLDTCPKAGDTIAWGESNAVVYANSVLGAKTLKNSNMLEVLSAITGRAPKAGTCVAENRSASLWLKVAPPTQIDDSFWPLLGYAVGAITSTRIPVITGVAHLKPSRDDLKEFSAAFATSSSASMFHMVSITPEAPNLEKASRNGIVPEKIDISLKDLCNIWEQFNRGSEPRDIDLISLGNPHLSCKEIGKLATLCKGKVRRKEVAVIVTCGRSQFGLASQAGYVEELEQFGVQFLQDTCWCFIEEPVIPPAVRTIMTNSGKYIHYGPGITGRNFAFGSLEMCVDAACTGRTTSSSPSWLLETKTS